MPPFIRAWSKNVLFTFMYLILLTRIFRNTSFLKVWNIIFLQNQSKMDYIELSTSDCLTKFCPNFQDIELTLYASSVSSMVLRSLPSINGDLTMHQRVNIVLYSVKVMPPYFCTVGIFTWPLFETDFSRRCGSSKKYSHAYELYSINLKSFKSLFQISCLSVQVPLLLVHPLRFIQCFITLVAP